MDLGRVKVTTYQESRTVNESWAANHAATILEEERAAEEARCKRE